MPNVSIDALYGLGVSHNKLATPLPDGTHYPDYGQEMDNRPGEFHRHFNRVRDKDWAQCSFLDLGCSEGSTTFKLSERNSTVYGVEGREDGVNRALALRDILGFNKTHFAVGNVNDESSYRPVDGIFNAGVLYHLDDPVRCLEQCAANARIFMYVDTGHMPRNDKEWRTAKFAPSIGKPYQIKSHGITLDVADFREPSKPETYGGLRRKPRSSIGNSKSVWLAHHSLVELMAKLGFPFHEVLRDAPHIPRLRTAFFRTAPGPVQTLGPVTKSLPVPAADIVQKTRHRDISYLSKVRRPVTIMGRGPLLGAVVADIKANGIAIDKTVELPDDRTEANRLLRKISRVSSVLAVPAVDDISTFALRLVLFQGIEYVFSSFAMAAQAQKEPAIR